MNFKQIALAAGAVALTGMAAAFPYQGGISFVGFGSPFVAGEDTSNATQFDFVDGPNAVATSANGDFTGLIDTQATPFDASFDAFTFHDFTFASVAGSGGTLVWDSSDVPFAFYLETAYVTHGSNDLEVEGQGLLKSTNGSGEEAFGYWNITVNQGNGTFSWSTSTSVFEPGSMALIGLGLAGLAASRRRQKGLTA